MVMKITIVINDDGTVITNTDTPNGLANIDIVRQLERAEQSIRNQIINRLKIEEQAGRR